MLRRLITLALVGVLIWSPAAATSISNGESGSSVRTKLNNDLATVTANVLDYGADPTGVADSSTAIQNAVNWTVANNFRGKIFFPFGQYKTTVPILLPSVDAEGGIILEGVGRGSCIVGQVIGYLFDRNTPTGGSAGPYELNRLCLRNTYSNTAADVTLTGTTSAASPVITGISSTASLVVGMLVYSEGSIAIRSASTIVSIDSGTQVTLDRNSLTSETTPITFMQIKGGGIRINATAGFSISNSYISSQIGVAGYDNAFYPTIDNVAFSNPDGINPPVLGTVAALLTATQFTVRGSSFQGYDNAVRGGLGGTVIGNRFEQNFTGIRWGADYSNLSFNVGGALIGNQFEANNIGIDLFSSASTFIGGGGIASDDFSADKQVAITSTTWAATAGGTVTAVTAAHGRANGTIFGVNVGGVSPSGYDATHVLATVVDATHFTYPKSPDPGGAGTGGIAVILPDIGIRIRGGSRNNMQAISISGPFGTAGIQYTATPEHSFCGGVVADNTLSGGSDWVLTANMAGLTCEQSNNPTLAVIFANLPASPVQGTMADLSDGATGNCADSACNWGTNVTGGGGSLKRKLYHNGSNWTVMAK